MAEVVVGLIKPVFAGRVEDVEIDSVFEGPGFVRHVGRDTQDLPCADDDLLAVNGKLKSTFEYVCDLLVVVVMLRDVRTFLELDTGEHDFIANDHLAIDERVELLAVDIFPGDVLHLL